MKKAPSTLDKIGRQKWRELSRQVDTSQSANADALACYCVAYSRWVQAEQQVQELGLIVKSATGTPCENPYLGIVKRSMVELHRWGRELGVVTKSSKAIQPEAPADDLDAEIRSLSLLTSLQANA